MNGRTICLICFLFIEKYYYDLPHFGFFDLEYLIYQGLTNCEKTRKEVSSNFKYIIVDEYQDTSWIQYSIINLIFK